MSWSTKLLALQSQTEPPDQYFLRLELRPPATEIMLAQAEQTLNCRFPDSLRSLLLETNGAMQQMSLNGTDWFDTTWIVFPLDTIIEQNRDFFPRYYPHRNLSRFLFFATASIDGIMFGFSRTDIAWPDAPVYAWYPDETDDKLMAHGLESFLIDWNQGRTTI